MKGLYLTPPHGRLIYEGGQSVLVRPEEFDTSEKRILVSGNVAYGTIGFDAPTIVDNTEFASRFDEHHVSKQKRERWWGEEQKLLLYPIKFEPFELPRVLRTLPTARRLLMGEVDLEVGEVKEVEMQSGDDGYSTKEVHCWMQDYLSGLSNGTVLSIGNILAVTFHPAMALTWKEMERRGYLDKDTNFA